MGMIDKGNFENISDIHKNFKKCLENEDTNFIERGDDMIRILVQQISYDNFQLRSLALQL